MTDASHAWTLDELAAVIAGGITDQTRARPNLRHKQLDPTLLSRIVCEAAVAWWPPDASAIAVNPIRYRRQMRKDKMDWVKQQYQARYVPPPDPAHPQAVGFVLETLFLTWVLPTLVQLAVGSFFKWFMNDVLFHHQVITALKTPYAPEPRPVDFDSAV